MLLVAPMAQRTSIARRERRRPLGGILFAIFVGLHGCALHYYDADKGVEHVWGLGHVAVKAPVREDKLRAVARRSDVLGLSIGKRRDEGAHLEIGWTSIERVDLADSDASLCLSGIGGSLLDARVGTALPDAVVDCEMSTEHGTGSMEKR